MKPDVIAAAPSGRSPLRTTVRALILVVVVAALATLVDPTHRATTARVALLAAGTIIAIGLVQAAARRTPPHPSSPFDPDPIPKADPPLPLDLVRLASDAERSRQPAATGLVTGVLDETVRAIAVQRLAHHHGIVVAPAEVADDPAASSRLGPATTALVRRRGRGRNDRPVTALDPLEIARELEAL